MQSMQTTAILGPTNKYERYNYMPSQIRPHQYKITHRSKKIYKITERAEYQLVKNFKI